MTEEELKKEQEEVAKEVEGKSQEELEAMGSQAHEELLKQIHTDACTYVWNLMNIEGTYDPEAYTSYIKEMIAKNKETNAEPYSRWSDEEYFLNAEIVLQGYGNFGKAFINEVLEKDPDSAKVLFETAAQAYLDIKYDYEALVSSLTQIANAKEQEQKNDKE